MGRYQETTSGAGESFQDALLMSLDHQTCARPTLQVIYYLGLARMGAKSWFAGTVLGSI